MNGNGEKSKKSILEVLKAHPEGLTIVELARIIGAYRQTVAKYVLVLEAAGDVYVRRIGAVTLSYLKDRFEKTPEGKNILEKMKRPKK